MSWVRWDKVLNNFDCGTLIISNIKRRTWDYLKSGGGGLERNRNHYGLESLKVYTGLMAGLEKMVSSKVQRLKKRWTLGEFESRRPLRRGNFGHVHLSRRKRFKELVEAYKILSDPEKHEIYDQYGEDALKEGMGGGGGGHGPFDIFQSFFDGGGSSRG
ncbi:dnaJ protein 2 [Artemisia annua]|uniref:DnaJ protein 2 n=1 Tax=Artemisia annua TaxID=35608 RepID=A0A2U1QE32_ARTAN|nr:dnaJ protein 2 [Artemisia annua]